MALAKELSDLLNIFGKRSRSEGEKKRQERDTPHYFSPPIQRGNVIDWGWMPKAKQDDQDQKEKPSRIIKYGDKGHYNNSDEEDDPTLSSKETISDVASVQLSNGEEIE